MKMPREEWIAVSVMLIIYAITLLAMLKRALAQRKIGNFVPIVKLKRFGILSFSVIALCAATIGLLSHTNIFDYEKPIPYDRYDDITFTNFRGIELFRRSLYGSKQFAYVVTTIDVDTGNGYIRVEALFHPSRSFVYNTHTNSQELLQHEKYHFKIKNRHY